MGLERVLQAARAVAVCTLAGAVTTASAAPADATHVDPPRGGSAHAGSTHERVAVIDLGPATDGGAARKQLAQALIAAGLDVAIGDGIEDALAGQATDKDAVQLASAIAEAQRAFGALDCAAATTASTTAIGIAAARQASGLAVPELPRAWTYVLLCADRTNDVDAAMHAARALRALGGSTEVPADVWAKYPAVDAAIDREMVSLTITSDVPGAEVYVDFVDEGPAPLKIALPAGQHWIAAAQGARRGWASGTAVPKQPVITVPTTDQRGAHSAIADMITAWHGRVPSPAELAAVLAAVKVRVAVIRYGDTIEAWGRIGASEAPRRLGGEDGVGTLADTARIVGLISDRIHTWNDRAPDPDQPLLVETPRERLLRSGKAEEPTRWWVYAAIIGAVGAAAVAVYAHDQATDTQHVELHFP